MRVRYTSTEGCYLKGNTHVHSRHSDGGLTFAQLEELYLSLGYDFLFRTDHWVRSDVAAETHRWRITWLDGVEIDAHDNTGAYYHVVGLGRVGELTPGMALETAMQQIRDAGALLVLAHPLWSGDTTEDALRWDFDGVEVYNEHCRWLNGKSCGLTHWCACLDARADTLGIASDDAHIRPEYPTYDGGWIVVRAAARDGGSIFEAIRQGEFYSSTGPAFTDILVAPDASEVAVRTPPMRAIRLVGPGPAGARRADAGGELVTSARFAIPAEWPWAYLEIEDPRGRRAWTNSLIVPDAP